MGPQDAFQRSRDEPVTVIVARARTDGDIRLDVECPPVVEVRAGQRLDVMFVFRVRDSATGKDRFRHTLESRIGEIEPTPVVDDHHDRPVLNDDKNAMIGQAYRFMTPGELVGTFRVVVEHSVTKWTATTKTAGDQREASGRFRVLVR